MAHALASEIDGEFKRLQALVQRMGDGGLDAEGSDSRDLEKLRRDKLALQREIREANERAALAERQVRRLEAELSSEREASKLLQQKLQQQSSTGGPDPIRESEREEYEAKIRDLEKRNAKDHGRMRILRKELMAQSREADHLMRQSQGVSRFGVGQSADSRMKQSSSTEGRLNAIANEYSQIGRAADALMLSGASGMTMSSADPFGHSTGVSTMFQTALPFEGNSSQRRRSVTVSMHRNGEMDVHLGASSSTNVRDVDNAADVTTPIQLDDLDV
eukprot:g2350.t1